jgi:hypothetical protein
MYRFRLGGVGLHNRGVVVLNDEQFLTSDPPPLLGDMRLFKNPIKWNIPYQARNKDYRMIRCPHENRPILLIFNALLLIAHCFKR